MSLFFHLSVHFLASLLVGYIIWKIWKKPKAAFFSAFAGGVLIDLDHFIDYFLSFGWSLNIAYFAKGYQFLKSDKVYILFHGWEYVFIVLMLGIILFRNVRMRTILFSLCFSMFFHLVSDIVLNEGALIKTYSVIYRAKNNFDLKPLVTNEHYQNHQIRKKDLDF